MSSTLSSSELVDHIVRIGIPDRHVAEGALRATLHVLGQRLTQDEAVALASSLPNALAKARDPNEYDGDFDAAEFYERVRRRRGAAPGEAREQTDVVLVALGEVINDDVRARVVRALPQDLGRLLIPRRETEPRPHPLPRKAPHHSTLATGRAGSRHPLSEGRPPAGHSQSVESVNPHADTKLSSSRGPTQERLDEALATGHPPAPARPISEANDD